MSVPRTPTAAIASSTTQMHPLASSRRRASKALPRAIGHAGPGGLHMPAKRPTHIAPPSFSFSRRKMECSSAFEWRPRAVTGPLSVVQQTCESVKPDWPHP